MSITIAICDDDTAQISKLRALLNEWMQDKEFVLDIDEYVSVESFLFSYSDKACDLILLDIEMKHISGMELARKLRIEGDMLPIVFVTGYSDYMNEGYEVEALHYLLKPIDKEKLFAVLDKFIMKRGKEREVLLPCEDKIMHVSPDMVMYCEAMGKKSLMYLKGGQMLECNKGIGTVADMLGQSFIYSHRSYVVNLRYIKTIEKTEVVLDSGQVLPLSKRLYKDVIRQFIDFYTK